MTLANRDHRLRVLDYGSRRLRLVNYVIPSGIRFALSLRYTLRLSY